MKNHARITPWLLAGGLLAASRSPAAGAIPAAAAQSVPWTITVLDVYSWRD